MFHFQFLECWMVLLSKSNCCGSAELDAAESLCINCTNWEPQCSHLYNIILNLKSQLREKDRLIDNRLPVPSAKKYIQHSFTCSCIPAQLIPVWNCSMDRCNTRWNKPGLRAKTSRYVANLMDWSWTWNFKPPGDPGGSAHSPALWCCSCPRSSGLLIHAEAILGGSNKSGKGSPVGWAVHSFAGWFFAL